MGFRFRRSVRVGGARINIGKRGISSVSFGRPGATLNINGRGSRSTFGIPGTGLSYSTKRGGGGGAGGVLILLVVVGFAVAGSHSSSTTTPTVATPPIAPRPVAAFTPALATVPSSATTRTSATLSDHAMRTMTGANMRAAPSSQAQVLRQLPPGEIVSVLGGEGTWAKVQASNPNGQGWVSWSLLGIP